MNPISQINLRQSPREVLKACFKSMEGGFPIEGGWGYTQSDACIINRDDPIVIPSLPFDGVGLEHVFVKKRTQIEMIILRSEGEKFSGIQWKLQSQRVIAESERYFDKLVYEITAIPIDDWNALKAEYEGEYGHSHPEFDSTAFSKKHEEKTIHLTREFWFDITSFYDR